MFGSPRPTRSDGTEPIPDGLDVFDKVRSHTEFEFLQLFSE
jgi:hypothetical protein